MQTFIESFQTVQQIRDYAAKKAVKGIRTHCTKCLFAELIRAEYPERFKNGEVIEVLARIITRFNVAVGVIEEYQTPRIVQEFIISFDKGRFPELEMQEGAL